eukprot:gene13104-27667_t
MTEGKEPSLITKSLLEEEDEISVDSSEDISDSDSNNSIEDNVESSPIRKKKRQRVEDDDDYIKFVRSVLQSDENRLDSVDDNQDSDEDEDEYCPPVGQEMRDEECDEDDDNEFVKVAKHEVHELVDGCWQTIANNRPCLSPDLTGNKSISNYSDDLMQYDTPSSPISPQSSRKLNQDNHKEFLKNNTTISNIVRNLLSGNNISDLCVDGMSVDTVRKLLARQMSMASQLLIQMLLIADQSSECYKQSYSRLFELSNHRE